MQHNNGHSAVLDMVHPMRALNITDYKSDRRQRKRHRAAINSKIAYYDKPLNQAPEPIYGWGSPFSGGIAIVYMR